MSFTNEDKLIIAYLDACMRYHADPTKQNEIEMRLVGFAWDMSYPLFTEEDMKRLLDLR